MKITLNTISGGLYNRDLLNSNFQEIMLAFQNTLSRNGDVPNFMQADIDMNGHSLLNAFNVYVDNGTTTLFEQVNVQTLALRNEMQEIYNAFNNFTISSESPSGGVNGDLWYKY